MSRSNHLVAPPVPARIATSSHPTTEPVGAIEIPPTGTHRLNQVNRISSLGRKQCRLFIPHCRQPRSSPWSPRNRRGQQCGNLPQLGPRMPHDTGHCIQPLRRFATHQRQTRLRIANQLCLRSFRSGRPPPVCLLQSLSCAGERVPLLVNQVFDSESDLNVPPPVKPLPRSALVGLQLRKLRLPESQHIRLHAADSGHIANLEIETVRNRGKVVGALLGKLRSHRNSELGHPNRVRTALFTKYRPPFALSVKQNPGFDPTRT